MKFIVYTNLLKSSGGMTINFLFLPISIILIQKKYKDNEGLKVHELVHAKQHIQYFCLFPVFYLFKKYKLKFETEAYIEQLKFKDNPESCLSWLPELFANKYKLFCDEASATAYIKNKILPEVQK